MRLRTQKFGVALGVPLLACSSPQEAARVDVPAQVGVEGITPVTTDLDYEVTLLDARVMARDFSFAIAGESHASLLRRSYDWLIPQAHAHPGHYQGGDITGELSGRFLLDWFPSEEAELGLASLIVGQYTSANFHLDYALESDLTNTEDQLLGHTALLRGSAKRGDDEVTFLALIDSPEDRSIEGIPFEYAVDETNTYVLRVQLQPLDALEGDTLFDGLDFLALDADSDGKLELSPSEEDADLVNAYNLLRRTLLSHDHFEFKLEKADEPDSLED